MKKTVCLVLCLLASSAFGQTKTVTFKANDQPIQSMLPSIFLQAGIKNYVIDPKVVGNVTFELTEQTLENVLKIICRTSAGTPNPLTYSKDGDVWIVEPRKFTAKDLSTEERKPSSGVSIAELKVTEVPTKVTEKITLNYLDPFDLQGILGPFYFVNSFSRFGNTGFSMNGNNSNMGNFGGSNGGFSMGSVGGLGGQNRGGNNGSGLGIGRKNNGPSRGN